MTTRDRSGCSSVVEKSSILETSPRTLRSSTYSPTRNGLVKMIVRPATRLLSTPCSAKPTPRPATPMPATNGAIWKPNLSSATTAAKSMTTILRARTIRSRVGGQDQQSSEHLEPVTDCEVQNDVFDGHERLPV